MPEGGAAAGSTVFVSVPRRPECHVIATADPLSLSSGLIGQAHDLCSPRGERQGDSPGRTVTKTGSDALTSDLTLDRGGAGPGAQTRPVAATDHAERPL